MDQQQRCRTAFACRGGASVHARDHVGGLLVDGVRERLRKDLRVHVAAEEVKFWAAPDFSRVSMPPGFPDALRSAANRFLSEYQSQLRPFDEKYEVVPGVLVSRTGGHTPGHSVVRLASGGDWLTFAGDAVFAVGFEHPDWYNGFEHDPGSVPRQAQCCQVNCHFRFWHIASFRCPAEFGRYRGIADRRSSRTVKLDLSVRAPGEILIQPG